MTVIETIRLIAPEFNDVSDATISMWEEVMSPMVGKKVFGKLYETALAYLICHKLKMTGEGESALGALGSVSTGFSIGSVSDGGTSISFSGGGQNNLVKDAEYGLTIYGTQYLNLRNMVVVPIHISGEKA